jgi:hypothetical protein
MSGTRHSNRLAERNVLAEPGSVRDPPAPSNDGGPLTDGVTNAAPEAGDSRCRQCLARSLRDMALKIGFTRYSDANETLKNAQTRNQVFRVIVNEGDEPSAG